MTEWHTVLKHQEEIEKKKNWQIQDYVAEGICPICGTKTNPICFCNKVIFPDLVKYQGSDIKKARKAYVKIMKEMQHVLSMSTFFNLRLKGTHEAFFDIRISELSIGLLFGVVKTISDKVVELRGEKVISGKPNIFADEIIARMCSLAMEGLMVVDDPWWKIK